jgi:hypothetical protein
MLESDYSWLRRLICGDFFRQVGGESGVGDGNRKHPETATKELTGARMTILGIVST